jgi:hypothetical protein
MKYGKLSLLSVFKLLLAATLTSIIVFFLGISLVSCSDDDKEDSEPVIPPTITSFTPEYGVPGSILTVTGTNFSTTASKNKVEINGIGAEVSGATATELVVIVPEATTGKVSVEISGEEAVSASDFEVLKDFPRNGLVGYFPFSGDGEEHGNDNEALNFNFALFDAPAFTTDRFAKTSQALSFAGDELAHAGMAIIPQNPWSVSVWIKYSTLTSGDAFMATMSSNLGLQIHFVMRPNTLLGINAGGDDGPSDGGNYVLSNVAANGYLPAGNTDWTNITMTYDQATFKIYRDGVEVESNAVVASTPPGPQLLLGRSSTDYFTGSMDDLIVYNRALSAAEVLTVSQQTVSKY